jgi:hypothetical protein
VKVLDFGLAKMGGTPTAHSDNSPTLTRGPDAGGSQFWAPLLTLLRSEGVPRRPGVRSISVDLATHMPGLSPRVVIVDGAPSSAWNYPGVAGT